MSGNLERNEESTTQESWHVLERVGSSVSIPHALSRMHTPTEKLTFSEVAG